MPQLSTTMKQVWNATYATGRRIVVAVIGVTVVALGVILIITPGPALVVIPLGLAILATEFVWARRFLARLRKEARGLYESLRKRGGSRETGSEDAASADEPGVQPPSDPVSS